MAKGDYLKVTYRTGVGTEPVEIVARSDGQKLVWAVPRSSDRFLEVRVEGRTDKVAETYMFASADVVAIISGHKSARELAIKPRKRAKVTVDQKESAEAAEQDPE